MPMRNMAPSIFDNCVYVFESILTPQECDDIVEYFKDKNKHPATTVDYVFKDKKGGTKENNFNNEKVRKGHVKFSRDIYDIPSGEKLAMAMEHVSAETGIIIDQDLLDFQLGIYDNNGDHFDWHKDHMVGASTFNKKVRKLSGSLQLSDSDDYTGCNLEVRTDNTGRTLGCSRAKGDFIVFPAWMNHRVTKLESGHRDALILWYRGPEFR